MSGSNEMQGHYFFEQGPIRPLSEAQSLLIRATRNCPWNKCAFCHTYRDTQFEMRSVEELKEDIQKAKDIEEHIRALSWKYGEGGHISKNIVNIIYGYEQVYNDSFGVDKDKLLGIIDGYFCLPYDDRLVYRIGRRIGMFREFDKLSYEKMYNRVKNMIDQYGTSDRDCMNKDLLKIMHRYIQ